MSVMKMYVEEYLNAEQVAENFYIIHLSNGKEIEVTERPVHNGNVWDWKVDSQVFDTDNYALNYLKKLVAEKLTGKRILLHKKREKGAFTIVGLTKKMDALRKARHLL